MDPEVKVLDGGTAVGYVRVSKSGADEQMGTLAQERSTAAQKQAITRYAEAHGMQIVGWYADVDRDRDLPGPGELLADSRSPERNFDTVLVYRCSYLGRNGVSCLEVMLELRDAGVTVVSVTDPSFDTSTGAGRLALDIIKILNEYQRELHSEATRRGIAAARRRREGC